MIRPRRAVHWLSWQPTPYNDNLFRHLAADPTMDLTVHYRSRIVASHPWQTAMGQGYRARYYDLVCKLDWHLIRLVWREPQAFFFVGGWDHPTSFVVLSLLRLLRRSYALWSDTPDVDRPRPRLFGRLRTAWLNWIFAGALGVMGTGRPGVENLRRMGVPEGRLVNFPYWIDIDAYARVATSQAPRADRVVRFISSGRIRNALKGHDVAVRALALAAKQTSAPFEYWIAGTGPDEAAIKELARSLGLEDRVKCLGWQEPEQLRELYRTADVLIHPSPVHEPYGVVVIEAMAAALVVLASDVTCAGKDRIDHGRNGYLHRAGDARQLAEQVVHLLENPQAIAPMGKHARATAEIWPLERGATIVRDIIQVDGA